MATLYLPNELMRELRRAARAQRVPVAKLARQLLRGHLRSLATAMPGNYEILLGYSLGRISERETKRQLRIAFDDDDALNALVILAGLPLPRLSRSETNRMRRIFGEMIDRYGVDIENRNEKRT